MPANSRWGLIHVFKG